MGEDVFVLPEAMLEKQRMLVPGTDGQKMSKSRNNVINIFTPDKALRKSILGIVTDSTPLEEPKDPDSCNAFAIYSLLADDSQIEQMRSNYLNGNYGYGHAKQAIYELIIEKFSTERAKYFSLMENKNELDVVLQEGAKKARVTANEVLNRVRTKVGYLPR